jgi:hypothetical protein
VKSEKELRAEVDAVLRRVESERLELMRQFNRRSRKKPVEDDMRRKSGLTDAAFLQRYRKLGTQTKLATELGISQPAVRKRLRRILKEKQESAEKMLLSVRFMFGDLRGLNL